MLLSLLPLLALGATSFAHPVLEERSSTGCSADNVLRHLRGDKCLADSLVFCSAYLGIPAITKTVAPLPTASVTVTEYQTVVTTETLIVTATDVDFNKIRKRVTTTPTVTNISTPPCLATTSIDPSRLSSACGCLTIPPSFVTVTAGEPKTASISVTEIDTVTSIIVSTTTTTITASGFAIASPTSFCGCNEDGGLGVAVGFIDDDYYRVQLPEDLNLEVYGYTSNVVLGSVNGLIWLDELATGNYQFYFDDSDTNAAALPVGPLFLPDVAILPFWSDFVINAGQVQGIWYSISGSAGSRVVTIEYIVSAIGSTSNDYHFTVALGESGSASANKVVVTYYSVLDGSQGTVAVQHNSDNKAITRYRTGTYDSAGHAGTGTGSTVSAGQTITFDTVAGTVSVS